MNYLAHLIVAEPSVDSVIGNLLGDFVKGPLDNRYSDGITAGIRLHRNIDVFSDSHPIPLHSRNLFSHECRRFAGIIVDVCYDHYLSRHWGRFCNEPRERFIARIYRILNAHQKLLPEPLRQILPRMINQDWLGSYYRLSGVENALNGISYRLKRRNSLVGSISEIQQNYRHLEEDFLAFFPDLIEFSENKKMVVPETF